MEHENNVNRIGEPCSGSRRTKFREQENQVHGEDNSESRRTRFREQEKRIR